MTARPAFIRKAKDLVRGGWAFVRAGPARRWKLRRNSHKKLQQAIKGIYKKHLFTAKLYTLQQNGVSLASMNMHSAKAAKAIANMVEQGHYQHEPAVIKKIYVKGKEREVFAYSLVDIIVHGAVASEIQRAIEPALSCRLYSYRKGTSWLTAVSDLAGYVRRKKESDLRDRGIFVLKRDIRSYGESIPVGPQSRIWKLLEEALLSSTATSCSTLTSWSLVESVVRPEILSDEGALYSPLRRIPDGQPISSVLLNLYLSELDRELEGVDDGFYARYSDDLLFAHSDLGVIKEVDLRIQQVMSELELQLHHKKSQNLYLNAAGRGPVHGEARGTQFVPFLGMHVGADATISLNRDKMKYLLRDIRKRVFRTAQAVKGQDRESVGRTVCSAINEAFLSRLPEFQQRSAAHILKVVTDRSQLNQIDYWIARIVLDAVTGESSVRAFREVPYRKLRQEWGLISLVHARNRSGRGKPSR